MALVAASTVLLAVLIALTLLPALLGLIGERIVSTKARQKRQAKSEEEFHSAADHWAKAMVRFRWPVILGVVAVLGLGAVPAASMDLGLPTGATANTDTAARQSYEAITRGFGEGFNGPLLVTVESASGAAVDPQTLGAVTQLLQQRNDVVAAVPVGTSKDGAMAVLSVIPTSGPDDDATADLVQALRAPSSSIAQEYDVVVGVTGFTAIGTTAARCHPDANRTARPRWPESPPCQPRGRPCKRRPQAARNSFCRAAGSGASKPLTPRPSRRSRVGRISTGSSVT